MVPDVGFQNPQFGLAIKEVVAAHPAAGCWSHGCIPLVWFVDEKKNTQRFRCQQYCCILGMRDGGAGLQCALGYSSYRTRESRAKGWRDLRKASCMESPGWWGLQGGGGVWAFGWLDGPRWRRDAERIGRWCPGSLLMSTILDIVSIIDDTGDRAEGRSSGFLP